MVRRKPLSNKSRHVSEGLADATGYDDACNFLSRNGVDVIEKQFRLEAVLRKVQQIDGTKKRATPKGGPMFRQNSALTSYACGEPIQQHLSPARLQAKKVLELH